MKQKFILLGVAIVAIGLMIMPYSVQEYVSGTHDWAYDGIDAADNNNSTWTAAQCNKCHSTWNGTATSSAATYHQNKTCDYCHFGTPAPSTNTAIFVAGNTHTTFNIPSCIQSGCHPNVAVEFANTSELHYEFYQEANGTLGDGNDSSDVFGKAGTPNEACIACHTSALDSVVMRLNWTAASSEVIYINCTGNIAGWTQVEFELT